MKKHTNPLPPTWVVLHPAAHAELATAPRCRTCGHAMAFDSAETVCRCPGWRDRLRLAKCTAPLRHP